MYLEELHFCMSKFVLLLADKANWALSPKTNFHIQKYDGFENIEKRSRALEVAFSSSADTNLVHNHSKFKKSMGEILLESYFLVK